MSRTWADYFRVMGFRQAVGPFLRERWKQPGFPALLVLLAVFLILWLAGK